MVAGFDAGSPSGSWLAISAGRDLAIGRQAPRSTWGRSKERPFVFCDYVFSIARFAFTPPRDHWLYRFKLA